MDFCLRRSAPLTPTLFMGHLYVSDPWQWSSAEHFIITVGSLMYWEKPRLNICPVGGHPTCLGCKYISTELKDWTLLPYAVSSWLQSSAYCFYCSRDIRKIQIFFPRMMTEPVVNFYNLRSFFCSHRLSFYSWTLPSISQRDHLGN